MKILILSIFTFLFCTTTYSQKKMGYLVKRDGTTEYGKLKFGAFNNLIFYHNKAKKKYYAKDLKEVVIYDVHSHTNVDTIRYKTIIATGSKKVLLLEETYKGKNISIYKEYLQVGGGFDANGGLYPGREVIRYYINFPNTHFGHLASSNKGFKKKLPNLLKDCPIVVDKLKSKIYKRDDLEKIVLEYDECISNQ